MKAMLNTLNFRRFLLIASDIILLYVSLVIAVYLGFAEKFKWPIVAEHLLPFSIIYFFWLIIFYVFGLYDLTTAKVRVIIYPKIIGALLTGLWLGMVFFYLLPVFKIAPKTNLILNIVIFGILFFIWRKIFYSLSSSRFYNNVAIVGRDPQKINQLVKEINARPYLGYKIAAIFDNARDLPSKIKEKKINTLIAAEDLETDFDLLENLYQCLEAKIIFLNWGQAYELFCEKIPVPFLDKKWFLENLKEGERKFYDAVKGGLDAVLSLFLLTLTLPLWFIIALLIKAQDGGPIFYLQKRIGKNKEPFFLFKFRSMMVGAEDKTGPVWAGEKDPRITKFGKLLRRLHLDELPQMINVLKGDISLVGPRPERPEFVQELEKEIPHYHLRHLIRPGFTGWAQIKFRYGRSVIDAQEKFQYDLYYLKNRSLFLDLGILLKTFQLFFKK